MSYRTRMT